MSTPARGFSIRFFLPDGTSDGMKVVEKSNWVGRAIVCPRSKFTDLRVRPEFSKTGVYLLVGQNSLDDPLTAYIGEGRNRLNWRTEAAQIRRDKRTARRCRTIGAAS